MSKIKATATPTPGLPSIDTDAELIPLAEKRARLSAGLNDWHGRATDLERQLREAVANSTGTTALSQSSQQTSSIQVRSQVHTSSVGAEDFPDLVAYPAKNRKNLFFTSSGFGRIVKAPVVPFHYPGKYRTRLVGISTDRDHRVHFLIQEFLEVLRTVTRNVDPNLFHGADR